MKVLHVTDDLSLVGGVQRYLATLRQILPRHGVECSLWAPRPGPLRGAVSRWFGGRYTTRLATLIDRERPDVVHAHNLWMRLSPFSLQAARDAGLPVVVTVHDYAWICPRKWMITEHDLPCERGFAARCAVSDCRGSREGRRWLPYNALRWLKTLLHRRVVVRRADRFISPSRHLASWVERSLGVSGVLHIPNFSAAPPDDHVRPVEHARTLLFAGRLSREKGVDVLLR